MSIELTQEQEQLVRGLVETGRYENDRAVLSQSLKLIQEYESRLAHLRAEIRRGEESGDYEPFDIEDSIRRARKQNGQRTAQ